jgi:hypothetical protein
MFTSRRLQVLLLLTCGITAVPAKAPNVVFGVGTTMCKAYVGMVKDPTAGRLTDMVVSWAQGYFSARNVAGRLDPNATRLSVGGTISADTLQAMLVDECNEEDFQSGPLFFAVEGLYNKLQSKGL